MCDQLGSSEIWRNHSARYNGDMLDPCEQLVDPKKLSWSMWIDWSIWAANKYIHIYIYIYMYDPLWSACSIVICLLHGNLLLKSNTWLLKICSILWDLLNPFQCEKAFGDLVDQVWSARSFRICAIIYDMFYPLMICCSCFDMFDREVCCILWCVSSSAILFVFCNVLVRSCWIPLVLYGINTSILSQHNFANLKICLINCYQIAPYD